MNPDCGSESSTLETDVCVWRYAPLVLLATQEKEDIVFGATTFQNSYPSD